MLSLELLSKQHNCPSAKQMRVSPLSCLLVFQTVPQSQQRSKATEVILRETVWNMCLNLTSKGSSSGSESLFNLKPHFFLGWNQVPECLSLTSRSRLEYEKGKCWTKTTTTYWNACFVNVLNTRTIWEPKSHSSLSSRILQSVVEEIVQICTNVCKITAMQNDLKEPYRMLWKEIKGIRLRESGESFPEDQRTKLRPDSEQGFARRKSEGRWFQRKGTQEPTEKDTSHLRQTPFPSSGSVSPVPSTDRV